MHVAVAVAWIGTQSEASHSFASQVFEYVHAPPWEGGVHADLSAGCAEGQPAASKPPGAGQSMVAFQRPSSHVVVRERSRPSVQVTA
jgi:hypothetical protein